MKKVAITYGTFDLFHIGHLNVFKHLHTLCDELIVAVSTDEFNDIKGKRALIPYEQRADIVRAIRYVDLVIPEYSWEQKVSDIQHYDVDIFAIGEDWRGKFDYLSDYCEVMYLPRTENISTTKLKKSLKNFLSIPPDDLIRAFEVIELLRKELD